MLRHMLRPFLPQLWTTQSSVDYSLKEIEARVTLILAEIEAEYDLSTFSLSSFAQWVQAKRGRPIQFVPLHFPPTVSGGWLKFAQEDLVFYEKDALPIYQAHIQLHEISHMLCGHQSIVLDDSADMATVDELLDYLTELFKDPNRIEDVLGTVGLRSYRNTSEEVEAEYLSTKILERGSVRNFEKVLTQPITFSKMAVEVYEAMGLA